MGYNFVADNMDLSSFV